MYEFLTTCLQAATPIWLAALGGMYAQRAGVVHLGLEGLMLTGAFTGTAVAVHTGSVVAAVLASVGLNLALSALFWLLVTQFKANVMIVGLGLSMTAAGGTGYALVVMSGSESALHSPIGLPRPLSGLTGQLEPFGKLSILTFTAVGLSWAAWWSLRRTRLGLRLSACGSDPFAARSAGVPVERYRLGALLVAGALCALGGVELSLASLQSFSENITQGRGYLAFAAVLLGVATPFGVTGAALFFGFATALGFQAQLDFNHAVPPQFVLMLPYAATIVAISVTAALNQRRGTRPATVMERTL